MPHIAPGFPDHIDIPKAQARRLVTALRDHTSLTHSQSLEVVAKLHGQKSWGHMRALLEGERQFEASDAVNWVSKNAKPQFPDLEDIVLRRLTLDDLAGAIEKATDGHWANRATNLVQRVMKTKLCSLAVKVPGIANGVFPEIAALDLLALCDGEDMKNRNEPPMSHYMTLEAIRLGIRWLDDFDNRERQDVATSFEDYQTMVPGLMNTELTLVDVPAIVTLKHSMLMTNDLDDFVEELEYAGFNVHDLSLRRDVTRLARWAGIDAKYMPLNHKSVMRILSGAFLEKTGVAYATQRARKKKLQVLLISLQDAIACGGTALLMAVCKSIGFHVVVHWDLPTRQVTMMSKRKELAEIMAATNACLFHQSGQGIFKAEAVGVSKAPTRATSRIIRAFEMS